MMSWKVRKQVNYRNLFGIVCLAVLCITPCVCIANTGSDDSPIEVRPFFFALSVQDIDRSSKWYERVFGFRTTRTIDAKDGSTRVCLMKLDGGFLELVELSKARALEELLPDLKHRYLSYGVYKVGFEVKDLDTAISRLNSLQVELRGDVITEPNGSMRSVQVEDPDGNIIQLFQLLKL